jgi:glycosyltransferase involved in cell wall biosynthesis
VIVLSEALTVGGAETFAVRLANGLAGAGHEVLLAVMLGEKVNEGVAASVDQRVAFEALRLPSFRLQHRVDRLLRMARVDWSLVRRAQARWFDRLVRSFKPDLVHSHLLKADALALEVRAAGHHDFGHVLTMHGDYGPFFSGRDDPQRLNIRRVIERTFGESDAVVAICREHATWVEEVAPAAVPRLHTILNGYAPGGAGPAPALEPGLFRFGMVSRGVRRKGWAEAIAAFEQLGRVDAELVLVGEGPFIAELRRRGVPPGVRLEGETGNPLGYIRQFDVCLLPTLFPHESLPTVVIEYLHAGKPVIATDVGEIAEMMRAPDGSSAGLLLSFDGEAIDAGELARAMRRLIEDEALRARLGDTARLAAAKFDMGACLAAYQGVYARVLAMRG